MDKSAAAGDDRILIPVAGPHQFAEFRAVADAAHKPFPFLAKALYHLAAPRDDAHGRILGIKLARINSGRPEICLRSRHHPVQVDGAGVGDNAGGNWRQPRHTRSAAILETAAAVADNLHLKFQSKILCRHVPVNQVRMAAGMLRGGFADDRAVRHTPELRVAVPAFEAPAIKERNKAVMIGKIEGIRFGES